MKNTEVAPTPASHNASPDLRSWLRRLAATGIGFEEQAPRLMLDAR